MAAKSNRPTILKLNTLNTTHYNASLDRNSNFIGQKISEARRSCKLHLAEFSELLASHGVHVGIQAISKWERGLSVPNAYQLLAISQVLQIENDLSYFMSVSPISKLNQEGLDKINSYRNDLIASGNYKPQYTSAESINFIEMRVSNLTASAGTGAFLDEGNFELVRFPESSVPSGAEFGIRVAGDSMEPVYHDGQIVWVQVCGSLLPGQVGIFVYDGEGYIKAYQEQIPPENDLEDFTDSYGNVHMQPVLISYNQKYEPRVVSEYTNFQIVGRVL